LNIAKQRESSLSVQVLMQEVSPEQRSLSGAGNSGPA